MSIRAKEAILRFLPKNTFVRGVGTLVGGTAGGQMLMLFAAPILTRLYGPEDFGVLAVYAGLLTIIGIFSTLRYEMAIPLPEDEVEAANVTILGFLFVGGNTLLWILIILYLRADIASVLQVPEMAEYLWLLPAGIFFAGAYTIFRYWGIRAKHFSRIAGTKLQQALATVVIQLTAFKLGAVALVTGHVAGQSVGAARLAKAALKNPGFKSISWLGIRKMAGRYRRFPLYSTWAGFLNTGGTQLPPIAFAAFFGPSAAGLYALAHRVLILPISVVGNAVSNVFLPNAAEASRDGQLGVLVDAVYDKLVRIALPPVILIVISGPELFALIFGSDWRLAGEFARWMAPWLFIQFCISPLTVFIVLERQDLSLLMQGVLFGLRVSALVAGYLVGGLYFTVIAFSVLSAIGYGVFLYVKLVMSGADIAVSLKILLHNFIFSLIYCLPIALSTYLIFDGYKAAILWLISLGLFSWHYFYLAKEMKNE